MKISALFCYAAAVVATAGAFTALPAAASKSPGPTCDLSDATAGNTGYVNCVLFRRFGFKVGDDPAADIVDLKASTVLGPYFSTASLMFAGRSDLPGGPFGNNPGLVSSGLLQIRPASPLMGYFALALQSADADGSSSSSTNSSYSYYVFDSAKTGSSFDLLFDTDGVTNASGANFGPTPRLLFAALFFQPAGPSVVPEPAGAALALTALGALALTRRRR